MSHVLREATSSISTKQMREAIQKSGYLLEQRVAAILTRRWGFVGTNPVFPDPETGKSREIDMEAIGVTQIYRKGFNFVFPILLCECVNNPQPVVFFTKESPISFMHHEEVKISGIPVKFWDEDKGKYVSFSEFTGMEQFHHYCKEPTATQYCTFQLKQKDKSSWMALHAEEQHEIFDSLIKATDYNITKHFDSWYLPNKVDEEGINVQIYYPLVVLQGSLYSAVLEGNRLSLKKSKHIQFRKKISLPRTNEVETYQIDVIAEEYLPDYHRIVDSEMVRKALRRRGRVVLKSITKIAEEARKLGETQRSYREALKF